MTKPLSKALLGPIHPGFCQSCGTRGRLDPPYGEGPNGLALEAWRECDSRDKPTDTIVVLCKKCSKHLIEPHELLYVYLRPFEPRPGSMPTCIDCIHRENLRCKHPDLTANGGEGLGLTYPRPANALVRLSRPKANGSRTSCLQVFVAPVECTGKVEECVPSAIVLCRLCQVAEPVPHWEAGKEVESGLCFSCKFWEDRIADNARMIEEKSPYIPCVIGGKHYCFQPGIFSDTRNCGMGGARYLISLNGQEFETNNLWCQGKVPPHFRERLPDNAERKELPRSGTKRES